MTTPICCIVLPHFRADRALTAAEQKRLRRLREAQKTKGAHPSRKWIHQKMNLEGKCSERTVGRYLVKDGDKCVGLSARGCLGAVAFVWPTH